MTLKMGVSYNSALTSEARPSLSSPFLGATAQAQGRACRGLTATRGEKVETVRRFSSGEDQQPV